jgi:hypothetical protein
MSATERARRVALVRLGWSGLLLAAPRLVLTLALAPAERSSRIGRAVVLILGLRNLVQSVIELASPTRPVLTGAAAVDAIHALTFFRLATGHGDRRWHRAAVLNVVTALGFCAATTSTIPTSEGADT